MQLAQFFDAVTRTAPGMCYFLPADAAVSKFPADVVEASCPGEKDTSVGEEKGSDLGFGKCDFVEFANIA